MSYYEIEHSGRPAVPRNYGIKKSCGEHIAFCDDDDLWEPDKLKLQMDKFSEDRDLGLVYSQCFIESRTLSRFGFSGCILAEPYVTLDSNNQ